jgi:hypothetical protein
MLHSLHHAIGNYLLNNPLPNCILIRDPACGGNQHIPLFGPGPKSRKTEYCNVDMLLLRDQHISVIIEIEEANIKPTQICGKFLASALAYYFIHAKFDNQPIFMDKSVAFIQVLDTSKLKTGKTSKLNQFENIANSIRAVIPLKNSKIDYYQLISGDIDTIDTINIQLLNCLDNFYQRPQ